MHEQYMLTTPVKEDDMLVLSRKLNEEIVIAGEIRVKVLELRRGRVRLGVCAPADVTVDRAEIALRNCFSDAGAGGCGAGESTEMRAVTLRAG